MAKRQEIQYVRFYVDGSAARKLDPVAPAKDKKPQHAPVAHRRKRKLIYIDPVAIFGIVVSVMMLVMMVVGINQLKAAQAQEAAMDRCVAQLQLDNRTLHEQYKREIDLADIEEKAIALGMVPSSQANVRTIVLPAPEQTAEPLSLWEQVGTFLAALFA